jgi:hypothetical protein
LLDRVAQALEALGLVGERRNALLIYLAAISRLLAQPVNAIVKGPSSVGKSYLLAQVIKLLPASAFVDYTAVSPKFLVYSDDDLRHRIVVLYEAGGIVEGMGAYIIRSLLSEGRLKLGTVDSSEGEGNQARSIEKEGPTALFTSTIRAAIDSETETRALSLDVADTADQSRAILAGTARAFAGTAPERPDLTRWHAVQDWLATVGERRVLIPYAPKLAALTPCKTIRIRRDFSKLLTLISASAILHQKQRQLAADGTILASLADYAVVYDLMGESFAAAQQDGLTPAQRKAVEVVVDLYGEHGDGKGLTLGAVAKRLELSKPATSRRLANPLEVGYVHNLTEGQKGKAAAYVPGEPLPPVETALPLVEALQDLHEVKV